MKTNNHPGNNGFIACRIIAVTVTLCLSATCVINARGSIEGSGIRERISINHGWRFFKYDTASDADSLIYDIRPEVLDRTDDRVADSRPEQAAGRATGRFILKPWILPSGNRFIVDPARRHIRPDGDPGSEFPFVKAAFDDSRWEEVNLPHDWAVRGPFLEGPDAVVGGGMGRLPVNGVGWYRKSLFIPESDRGKSIFLDVDGVMSYAMIWLNGHLVGGWPYGYNSWRLDLTPYIITGSDNQLAIRVDNPPHSARWYPGAGIYRNVWIVKTNPVHIAQWGTFVKTKEVSGASATAEIEVTVDNNSGHDATVAVANSIFALDDHMKPTGEVVAASFTSETVIPGGGSTMVKSTALIDDPAFWRPLPAKNSMMYVVISTLMVNGLPADTYETPFGIRTVSYDPGRGIVVNGEPVTLRGVNLHHDLGALGAAFNLRAAERQLEMLREMGCNAIRTSHNPPAPEFLDLTDRMGFLVIDEIFDTWAMGKTPLDFHLIFPDWYEQDTRAFVRRDRNHPSVILWSYGNEVGEQYTGEEGAKIAVQLEDIVREEDPTRPSTTSMNYARPGMAMPAVTDLISLNYQGEGIRDAAAYAHLKGIRTSPLYGTFRETYPDKVILSSETASTLSTRGTYLFPVFSGISAPAADGRGADPSTGYVSSYELYTAPFGASPDKVFAALDHHMFVAGEFVWTGWDYLGEPTPYYFARSSYSGIIDLAGFKKDRYWLYQSRWRPELPIAHLLPSWNWPGRIGEVTPVHLFTTGDEAELYLNGKSQGRLKKQPYEYRLRWDSVIYEPGVLQAVVYKEGARWAEDKVETTGSPVSLVAEADRKDISSDNNDLSFITVRVTDSKGLTVTSAGNLIEFSVRGPGEIVGTDNGDPTDMTEFASHARKAFNGLVLVIVRPDRNGRGAVRIKARSAGLTDARVVIRIR